MQITPESAAEFVEALATLLAAGRLIQLGFAKRQPALLGYLLFTGAYLLLLSATPLSSFRYFWIYVVSIVITWFVSLLVVREMFALALDPLSRHSERGKMVSVRYHYARNSRIPGYGAGFLAGKGAAKRTNLYYILVVQRSVVFTLAIIGPFQSCSS